MKSIRPDWAVIIIWLSAMGLCWKALDKGFQWPSIVFAVAAWLICNGVSGRDAAKLLPGKEYLENKLKGPANRALVEAVDNSKELK